MMASNHVQKSAKSNHKRYQSTVVHLPQHIAENSKLIEETVDGTYLSLKTDKHSQANNIVHANAKSIQVVDELAQFLALEEEPHPNGCECITIHKNISPKTQTTFLWLSIALFAVAMLISTMLFAQKSTSLLYITQLICSILGLILAYFYNANMHFTYNLSNKLEMLLKQQKELKKEALQLEKELLKTNKEKDDEKHEQISLLQSFRDGYFHQELAYCDSKDIKQLLPVIVGALCQLPFGFFEFQTNLFVILANRISSDAYLDQSWRFFLNSNRDLPIILRTWQGHQYLKQEKEEKVEEKVEEKEENCININCVKWFSNLFNMHLGAIKQIDSNKFKFLCDPINGNILSFVKLSGIMAMASNSNKKKYLIENYTLNNKLSSVILLKQGYDLRKDLGVILMFKYFNQLFQENNVFYNGIQCKVMTFEVVPMAFNFGCVEFIENTQKMNNIAIDEIKIMKNELINRLIASGAASYVSSHILGVGVGVNNNFNDILICNDATLFNTDFSHILGEKLASHATVAISSKFVKILGNESNDKWNQFVDVVVECFSVLRKNYIQILDYARIVFGFMQRRDKNEKYLKHSFFINVKQEREALDAIKTVFSKALSQIKTKTKTKNITHPLDYEN